MRFAALALEPLEIRALIQTPSGPPVDAASPDAEALPEHSADIQLGRDLLLATRPFAIESVAQSWWHVFSTYTLLIAAMVGAGLAPWWPVRALLAVLSSLIMVRTFILYHDYMHGAILRKSRFAAILFYVYGCWALTPPNSWAQSHNYHHGHVGQITTEGVGAFPLITARMWREASRAERARYRATRHPLIVLFGYITIFAVSITLLPLLRSPSKHRDSALGLLLHGGLIAVLWAYSGFQTAFFVVLLPMTIASILGSYLFFAQHSFKHMIVMSKETWTFYRASLKSSSYMRLNRIMQWFTGNIGYHHVHHLNVRIPFYRLPEAMAAIPDLQSPITTSLAPQEIVDCFRASLWDEEHQRMVSYGEAAAS
jgi:acyl-lipid omega-6 desaturase (Delta-12 desaturase)